MPHPDLLTDADFATKSKLKPPGKYVNMWLILRPCVCDKCETPFAVNAIVADCCTPPYDSVELAEIGAQLSIEHEIANGGLFSHYEGPERLP